ncbi:hypothetical protein CEXT_292461 [Caerostris extrusa]|uniref:Uncharacterized protein n=1 Tax=Caerostris extrusa TaxID=172846 RepID=A0AAV4W7A2_CAEEX|nr:hypothetical protein CEXT_292461 [Caerostris extrusa]
MGEAERTKHVSAVKPLEVHQLATEKHQQQQSHDYKLSLQSAQFRLQSSCCTTTEFRSSNKTKLQSLLS